MGKKNEYEIAVDYYDNNDNVEFDIDEAIRLYEIAALNKYTEAYYDLAILYVDNYDNNDEANQKAFKYMKLAAEHESKDAYVRLAEMYLNKKYKCKNRYFNAVYWYLKTEINLEIENIILVCLDKLKDQYLNKPLNEIEALIKRLRLILNITDNAKINDKILSICYYYFSIMIKNGLRSAKTKTDFYNIKTILDNNYKWSTKLDLINYYYLCYGNFLFDSVNTLSDADNVFDVYNKMNETYIYKRGCLHKIYRWKGMYLIENPNEIKNFCEPIEFFEIVDSVYFKKEDFEKINSYILYLVKDKEYRLAYRYLTRFIKLNRSDANLKIIRDKLSPKIEFIDALEASKNGDYDAKLYIANAYYTGNGVDKNIEVATKQYLDIFVKYNDLKSLDKLYEIKKDVDFLREYLTKISNNVDNIINNALKNYFNLKNGFKTIDNNSIEVDLKSSMPTQIVKVCSYCSCIGACSKWWNYSCKQANMGYKYQYYESYCSINETIFNELFNIHSYLLDKKEITIVLVGCGNFYELKTINTIAQNNTDVKINIIILDEFIWLYNSFEDIVGNIHLNSIKFKGCDFYEELKKYYYRFVDIIYFSRCLDHYKYYAENIIKKIDQIINPYQLTVFSQAVNGSSELARTGNIGDPITFEEKLRTFFKTKWSNPIGIKITIGSRQNSNDIGYDSGINYFAYFLKERRK